MLFSCSVVSDSLRPQGLQHARLPCPNSEFAQIRVLWGHDAIQPPHPPSPPFFPASIRLLWIMCMLNCFSRVWLFVTPWTVARQALLSMGFLQARRLEWVTISFSRGSPDPGVKPPSLTSLALVSSFFISNRTWEALSDHSYVFC